MRVISGYLKGKNILGYNVDGTRPTMDRVKESMFASIQGYIDDASVLDLFCGSGSLGIEAISMGARDCYFVDNGIEILKYLNMNISNMGIKSKCNIINRDYRNALLYFRNNGIKFNVILIDAPYKMEVIDYVIGLITEYDLLYDNGIVVCEYSTDKLLDIYGDLKLYKKKKYGDKYVNIYHKVID